MVKQSDETFSEELVNCDGTQAAIVSNSQCEIPLMVLYAAPYSLVGGSSVYAKVSATNSYGTSIESDSANGASIVLVPDAPLQFKDNPLVTSETVVGLTWTDGVSNGGKPIEDYTVSYDQSTGNWIELESGILTQSYSSTATLISGANYQFKV